MRERTPSPRTTALGVLLVGALLGASGRLHAQAAPDSVDTGDRVRISLAPSGRRQVTGTVDSVLGAAYVVDTVGERRSRFRLDPGPTVLDRYRRTTVRFSDILRLEVSRGVNRPAGAFRYGLIGAGIGALVFGVGASSGVNPSGSEFATGAGQGAVVGALVGGTVGWFIGRERWASAPQPVIGR